MATRITDLRSGEGGYAALDDRMLVLDFQAGHPEAFVEIHGRYGGLARHVCGRYLPNPADADEAFQETMIRVFQGLYRFNGQYALQSWVARIATNVSLDILRGRARRPSVDDRSLDDHDREDPGEGPDEAVERLVQRDLILAVLSDMPDAHRRALVLRELEGLSHKEIGEELDLTPSQAKALIHRAKGNFRRRWLRAITDRGGFMALALVPAMWAMRAIGGARRVVDKAVQATITTDIVSSAASSASAAPVATSAAERVVAAATVTVLLAGGITVGAATFGRNGGRDQPVERATGQSAGEVAADVFGAEPADDGDEWIELVRPGQRPRSDRGDAVVVETPLPSETPAAEAPPTSTPPPEPPPEPSPPVVVPPVPAWASVFQSSMSWDAPCDGCPSKPELVSSSAEGLIGEAFAFTQVIQGSALDANGEASWPLRLEYAGSADGAVAEATGRVDFTFSLGTEAGQYRYSAFGTLQGATAQDGGTRLLYMGPYVLDEGPDAEEAVPQRGVLYLEVLVWADGTSLYSSVVTLQEG